MKDALVLAYGNSMQFYVQDEREVLLGDVDPLYVLSKKECADNNVSRNNVTV